MPKRSRITVTALEWVPSFAAGQMRDHRLRWILNEIGWDYEVERGWDPAIFVGADTN